MRLGSPRSRISGQDLKEVYKVHENPNVFNQIFYFQGFKKLRILGDFEECFKSFNTSNLYVTKSLPQKQIRAFQHNAQETQTN